MRRQYEDLCTRELGRRYDQISRLNQTDYLVEFEMSDNPTLFTIELGNRHNGWEWSYTWMLILGLQLH